MDNGIEVLPNWVEDIAIQAIKNGIGFEYQRYYYIDIPFWGVLRFDFNTYPNIYCDGYVPWIGY